MALLIETRELSKAFPGVRALDRVDLSLEEGTIHALVGENGAGKSTLIEILAGTVPPDSGRILLAGAPVTIDGPQQAWRLGIGVVHQHSHLIPDLSVAENFALRAGYPQAGLGRIAWGILENRTTEALRDLAPDLDSTRPAGELSGVEKQLVELSFAFAARPRLLILDEPTAVLPQRETEALFARVRTFSSNGGCVLFITHRLDEVFVLSERVAVLRDGLLVREGRTDAIDRGGLIRAMVGRQVDLQRQTPTLPTGEIALQVESLTTAAPGCRQIDLRLRAGEIYGLYGLVGAGQSALCQALFGLGESRGRVRLQEREIGGLTPAERVRCGLAYVPAERRSRGLFYALSVGENLSLVAPEGEWLSPNRERAAEEEMMHRLQVRARGTEQAIGELSGGNQQKVLLGRWMRTRPRVLLLEEPTQGVDVGAKGEIHRIVRQLAAEGVAVLLVSSELPEVTTVAHRIGVMRSGRLVAELDGDTAADEEILHLALPTAEKEERAQADTARRRATPQLRRELSLAGLILLLAGLCAWLAPAFATWRNLTDIALNNAVLLIGALAVGLVIVAGSIDISIGALLGLAAVVAGLGDQAGWPGYLLTGGALFTGALLGLLNGALAVYGRVHAIVITLGTLTLFRGTIIQATGGRWLLNLSPTLTGLGAGRLLGLPYPAWMALLVVLGIHFLLAHTRPGRRLYALGSDAEAAGFVGIRADRTLPWAFALCGLLLGLAGLLHAARYGQVQTNVGLGFELKAIAAAVIGGTHIAGGRGRAIGILLGTLLIGLIANGLVLLHVPPFWEGIFVGGVILLTVGLDALFDRGTRQR